MNLLHDAVDRKYFSIELRAMRDDMLGRGVGVWDENNVIENMQQLV